MNWIVSELFYPDEVSTALIMTEIAQEMAKSADIKVICGPGGYEKSYKEQQFFLNDKITINRVKIAELNKNKLLSRIISLFLLSVRMSFRVLKSIKKGDHVLLVTNPAFLILAVSLIKQFKGFKLSILIHDVFPENLVPGDYIKSNSWKYKMVKSIYDSAYRKADKLIVLGNDMKELMIQKLEYKVPPIEVITNWADEKVFPLKEFDKSEYLGVDVKDKVVIGFAGNLGRLQGLPEFLNAFNEASNQNIQLVLIGDGALKNEIESLIEKGNVRNVILLGSKPRVEQNLFLNSCDIGLITLKRGMKGLGVPSKTYNIMAAGKALLYVGDKQSEVDEYIKNYSCGWSFCNGQRAELISFLSTLSLNMNSEISIAGENAHNAVVEFYLKKQVLSKFGNII